jgi:hypothetical protein
MNDPDYQVIYGVGLLDDLHNYFPGLLYEQGRYQNLSQVFSYVRNQMNTRFNLNAYGASLYRQSTQRPARQPPVRESPLRESPLRESPLRESPVHFFRTGLSTGQERFSEIDSIDLVSSLLRFYGPRTLNPPRVAPTMWDPVTVAPSTEVLATNTEIISGSTLSLTQDRCSICQDSMLATDTCRNLRPCQHVFHTSCIDQWFLRSVYCPTCRHDIRVATPPSPRLTAATPHEVSGLDPMDISGNVRQEI